MREEINRKRDEEKKMSKGETAKIESEKKRRKIKRESDVDYCDKILLFFKVRTMPYPLRITMER